MIKKIENCIYCGEKMADVKSAKRKFCNDVCRIYYKREIDRGSLSISGQNKPEQAKKEAVKGILPLQADLIDFGQDKWFLIDNYTKFQPKERPEEKIARSAWDLQKKLADNEIRKQWKEQKYGSNK